MAEIIRKQALLIDDNERSWEDALRVCGRLMQNLGSVEEGYIQAMIDGVNKLGPYIMVAPHIAFAHAAAGKHVLKNDLVLTVFKKPVIFNSGNDPLHIMFGLCALEPSSHLELLKQLADAIGDGSICDKFMACDSTDELYKLINNTIS